MRRSFGIDVLQCKHCGGVLKLVDIITHPRAIRAILQSLGLPTEPPLLDAARAPPDDYADSAWGRRAMRAISSAQGCFSEN